MNRRKKSAHSPRISSPPTTKRRRIVLDSSSPVRRKNSGETVRPPPENPIFEYAKNCPTLMKYSEEDSEELTLEGKDLISLQHEVESMLAKCLMDKRRVKGELQFLNDGDYPKVDLRKRQMPKYETRVVATPSSPTCILEKEGICGLPEEDESEDLNTEVAHIPTRFWSWCKEDFLKNIDGDYLRQFKQLIVDKYSNEEMSKYFVNEPWKYRARTAPKRSNRSLSGASLLKTPKRVSISNDVECSNGKSSGKKVSSATKIPSRRNSEKEALNNNKIMPMIGNMVISACREMKEPKLETSSRRKSRALSKEESKDRRASFSTKTEMIAVDVDVDDEETINGYENGHRISPRLHSPRHLKKEKDDEFGGYSNGECRMNGNSTNGHVNGHSNGKMNGDHSPKSPKRKNGEYKNGLITNGSTKRKSSSSAINAPIPDEKEYEDVEVSSFIEDFDAKVIGSRIVSKLIAGGILPDSSAQIFEQMSKEEGGSAGTSKIQISEEGRDEAEDPTMDELSEELKQCQLELQEVQPQLNALVTLSWRRAKAQYAFYYSFDQMRAADYDLFKLGVNNYREFPRRLPTELEKPLLKSALIRRNKQARFHYGNTYRRHPKFRWRLKPTFSSTTSRKRTSTSP